MRRPAGRGAKGKRDGGEAPGSGRKALAHQRESKRSSWRLVSGAGICEVHELSTSELQREKFAEDKGDDGNRRYCERSSCQQGKPTARTLRLREASGDHEFGLWPTLGHERFRASPLARVIRTPRRCGG